MSKTGASGAYSSGQRLQQHRPSAAGAGHRSNAGQTYREGTQINKSLLFLQLVIKSLQDKAKGVEVGHISYRNCELTKVLRDSLGGNCLTSMIATINPDARHIEESLSTCRFAQSVSCVSNNVRANEEVDPQVMIKRLKRELEDVKNEMALRGDQPETGPISDTEASRIKDLVKVYLADKSAEAKLKVGGGMSRVRLAFSFLKDAVMVANDKVQKNICPKCGNSASSSHVSSANDEEVQMLRAEMRQRDLEISQLLMLLKGAGPGGGGGGGGGGGANIDAIAANLQRRNVEGPTAAPPSAVSNSSKNGGVKQAWGVRESGGGDDARSLSASSSSGIVAKKNESGAVVADGPKEVGGVKVDVETLKDRNKAFEAFRRSYRRNEVIESQKEQLKSKYSELQAQGQQLKGSRDRVVDLKRKIEMLRTENALQTLSEGGEMEQTPEELETLSELRSEQARCKLIADEMRANKSELENMQRMLDHAHARLKNDFQQWFDIAERSLQSAISSSSTSSLSSFNNNNNSNNSNNNNSSSSSSKTTMSLPVAAVGDASVDSDIAAFYKAREQIEQRRAAASNSSGGGGGQVKQAWQ